MLKFMEKKRMKFVILPGVIVLLGIIGLLLFVHHSKPEVKVKMYSDQESVYQNPYTLPHEWQDYGIGDPFILRYDGRYYLYCSTKDGFAGVKSWSSTDLVHWKYEGLVTKDPITTSAYAPEVVYWNGYFYMYTSPAGKGHYVLKSDSPTGPFQVETQNLGMSIDGSVFIDDDGKWYFTHAGTQGIVIHPMSNPYTMGPGKTVTGAFLDGWTEGPTIIKRDGTYFMTYTGNHVFSKGYRVNYSVAHGSPMGDYTIPDNNPILIHTTDGFDGLGHSSSFIGPDLDSYYIVYHNLVGRSQAGPPVRQMDIDRLVFNGDRMDVLGPTHNAQPVPKLADFHSRLDDPASKQDWHQVPLPGGGQAMISKEQTAPGFTAEYNFKLSGQLQDQGGYMDALFSYQDKQNYWAVRLYPAAHRLSVVQVVQGNAEDKADAELPDTFDFTKLHTIRVERGSTALRVYFDSMRKINLPHAESNGGSIGYASYRLAAHYFYTAFTNDVDGSSDDEVYKPLPGRIEGMDYLKGENRGFSVRKKAPNAALRPDDGVAIQKAADGSYAVNLEKSDCLKYKVHISDGGTYGLYMTVKPDKADTSIQVSCCGREETLRIPAGASSDWQVLKLGSVTLPKGYHALKITVLQGNLDFKSFGLYQSAAVSKPDDVFQSVKLGDIYGEFHQVSGGYQGSGSHDDRIFAGNTRWDDYEVSVNVGIPKSFTGEGSVLVRVTNESYFPLQVRDSMMGYAITLTPDQLELQKLNYDNMTVDSSLAEMKPGHTYPLRIRLTGSRIRVYWNGAKQPILDYVDPHPFFYGRVGIRSDHSTLTFTNMQVAP